MNTKEVSQVEPFEFRIISKAVGRGKLRRKNAWAPLEDELTNLSSAGWELVDVSVTPSGTFLVGAGEFETVVTAVLRRQTPVGRM